MRTRNALSTLPLHPALDSITSTGTPNPRRMHPMRDPEGHPQGGGGGTGSGGTGSGAGGNGDDKGKGGTGSGGDNGGGDGGGQQVPPGTYTRDDVTRIVEQRVGELTRRHEQALQQAREDAGKSDTARLEAERDRAVERAENAAKKAAPKVAQALAQVAAIAAGGRPDRAAAIVRQADLDGVAKFEGDDFTVDESRMSDAIAKVLDEYPEWKAEGSGDGGNGGNGDGGKGGDENGGQQQRRESRSGGDLGGGGSGDVDLATFKRMSMGERGTLRASDPEAYRRLADAEIAERRTPGVRS